MKLEPVIVFASIVVEKVAVGATEVTTPLALLAGVVEVTVGAEPAVANDQLKALASATPSAALTVVSSLAVYVVELASAALGVSVAFWLALS